MKYVQVHIKQSITLFFRHEVVNV